MPIDAKELNEWRAQLLQAQQRCDDARDAGDVPRVRDAIAELARLACIALPVLIEEVERLRGDTRPSETSTH